MLSHIIRAALAGAAALGIASCAFGAAVSASYLGMGTSTGTPSGDVLAIINPHQRDRSPIISRDGGRVPDDGLERPEAVGQLNFQRPMRIAVHNEPGSEPDAEMINATKEFIRVMFGSQNVNIYYLNDRDLSQSIRTGGVDFFIADQSFYALEQAMGGVEQIAVMWPGTGDSPSEAMASTFFRKKPADGSAVHDPLTYVATHELAAMTPKSMSAWLIGAGSSSAAASATRTCSRGRPSRTTRSATSSNTCLRAGSAWGFCPPVRSSSSRLIRPFRWTRSRFSIPRRRTVSPASTRPRSIPGASLRPSTTSIRRSRRR